MIILAPSTSLRTCLTCIEFAGIWGEFGVRSWELGDFDGNLQKLGVFSQKVFGFARFLAVFSGVDGRGCWWK